MEGYRNIMVSMATPTSASGRPSLAGPRVVRLTGAMPMPTTTRFDEQAAWTVEAYQMMQEWGWVGPAFLWNLNFRVVADGTEKAQWGIVRNDYSAAARLRSIAGPCQSKMGGANCTGTMSYRNVRDAAKNLRLCDRVVLLALAVMLLTAAVGGDRDEPTPTPTKTPIRRRAAAAS